MRYQNPHRMVLGLLLGACAATTWGCDLSVEQGWIREAPPTVKVLGGYALLINHGHDALSVTQVHSDAFEMIEMHESTAMEGVMQMRPLAQVLIPAGQQVRFSPDAKHFMFMNPRRPLQHGDKIDISFVDGTGCTTRATFTVQSASDAALAAPKQ